MRRRDFMTLVGGAAAGWPLAARAQQSDQMRRIGVLMSFAADDATAQARLTEFLQTLQQLGWMDGRNVRIDIRWSASEPERIRRYAAELVAFMPDVILASTTPGVAAVQQASRTVPIVFVQVADPVGAGLVASLAKPGSNATGFTIYEYGMAAKWLELLKDIAPRVTRAGILRDLASVADIGMFGAIQSVAPSLGMQLSPITLHDDSEIDAKRLELLKEMLPSARRVACLSRTEEWESPWGRIVEVAAQKLGLTMVLAAHTTDNYEAALALVTASRVDALFVYPGANQYGSRKMLVDFASKNRLPDSHGFREAVEVGGLMSYGASIPALWQRAATYVDKILKGANPGELPIMLPTKFEFVINRRTADALGIPVPSSLIALTDEVIE